MAGRPARVRGSQSGGYALRYAMPGSWGSLLACTPHSSSSFLVTLSSQVCEIIGNQGDLCFENERGPLREIKVLFQSEFLRIEVFLYSTSTILA